MYVCLCEGLRESDIRELAFAGIVSAATVVDTFGLDDEDCCGRCAKNVYELVALATHGICSTSQQAYCPGAYSSPKTNCLSGPGEQSGQFRDSLPKLTS